LFYYGGGFPSERARRRRAAAEESRAAAAALESGSHPGSGLPEEGKADDGTAPASPPEDDEVPSSLLAALVDGIGLIRRNPPVLWRLVFLALEIALEDAMVAVLVAEYALSSHAFGRGNTTVGNLWTAAIIAVGKIGAVLSGYLMHRLWKVPETAKGYTPLFFLVLAGSLSVLLLPAARHMEQQIGMGCVFLGVFLFFLFSTPPKVGFETLLQSMTAELPDAGRIFGCIPPLIMITDSTVVFGLTVMFERLKTAYPTRDDCAEGTYCGEGFDYALWIAAGLYCLHGCFEVVLGPTLVLSGARTGNGLGEALLDPSDGDSKTRLPNSITTTDIGNTGSESLEGASAEDLQLRWEQFRTPGRGFDFRSPIAGSGACAPRPKRESYLATFGVGSRSAATPTLGFTPQMGAPLGAGASHAAWRARAIDSERERETADGSGSRRRGTNLGPGRPPRGSF
jgi:hypothetical protein